jgi:hypothetical protein
MSRALQAIWREGGEGELGEAVGVVRVTATAEAYARITLGARAARLTLADAVGCVAPGVERAEAGARVGARDQDAVAAGAALAVGAAARRRARGAASVVVADQAEAALGIRLAYGGDRRGCGSGGRGWQRASDGGRCRRRGAR